MPHFLWELGHFLILVFFDTVNYSSYLIIIKALCLIPPAPSSPVGEHYLLKICYGLFPSSPLEHLGTWLNQKQMQRICWGFMWACSVSDRLEVIEKGANCNPSDCLGATVNLADVQFSLSLILPVGLSSVDRCHFKWSYDTGIGNAQPLSSKCQMSRVLQHRFFLPRLHSAMLLQYRDCCENRYVFLWGWRTVWERKGCNWASSGQHQWL